MTAQAHVQGDWERARVQIAVRLDDYRAINPRYLKFAEPEIITIPSDAPQAVITDDWRLSIPEEAARAIYEALADHFGHSGHDTRTLRRDYEAERKRVDNLIGFLTR